MSERKHHSWIGGDHPPGWRRVGQIDVVDPADGEIARVDLRAIRVS